MDERDLLAEFDGIVKGQMRIAVENKLRLPIFDLVDLSSQ